MITIVSFLDDAGTSARASSQVSGNSVISRAHASLRTRRIFADAAISGELVVTAAATLTVRFLTASTSVSGETVIETEVQAIPAGATVFRGTTVITARPRTRLPLREPVPILNELAADAFSKPFYAARLVDDSGAEIKITSATIEAPRGAVGKRVSLTVAKKDLSLVTADKTYVFQIGTRLSPVGAVSWETIVEGGALNSRSFSLAQNGSLPSDNLTFGTIEPLKHRLNRFPRENTVLYNSRRTTVEIASGDRLITDTGASIGTNSVAINYLSLRDVFDYLKKVCAFEEIVTNLPNFELTRVDFPITNSYLQSVGGVVGIFEPVIFSSENTLYILDKTAAVPPAFTPRALSNAVLSDWQISIDGGRVPDGFLVSYAGDETNATYFTERLVQTTEESGRFGDDDYTRTEIETVFREWRSFDQPNQVLRSEMRSQKRETYFGLATLGSRRRETHSFDSLGRRTGTTVTFEARVPQLPSGAPVLQTVREETQNVFYTTDSRDPRRSLQSRVVTRIRGLVAVDAGNTYFDAETGEQSPFKQDFLEAHKAGNLKEEMTTDYSPLKTVTETLVDLGGGQYQMSVSTLDHLRKTETQSFSEPKTGDAGVASAAGKQNRILVLQEGMTQENRPGGPIETLAVGELPLFFAVPLAKRKLAGRRTRKQSGTATVAGYSRSVERGTFFRLFDRSDNPVGKFICTGYRVEIRAMGDGCLVRTSIEADEI